MVTKCLDYHRKSDCKYGRITCAEDFKYLARRVRACVCVYCIPVRIARFLLHTHMYILLNYVSIVSIVCCTAELWSD